MGATEHDRLAVLSAGNFIDKTKAPDLCVAKDFFCQLGMELRVFQSADLAPITLFSLRRDGRLLWLDSLSSHDSLAALWAAWCRYLDRLYWHQSWLGSMAEMYSSARPSTRHCVTEWVEQFGRAREHQKDQWPWNSASYCPVHGKLVFVDLRWKEVGSCNVSFDLQSVSSLLHFDPDYPEIYMESARRLLAISDRNEIGHATGVVEDRINLSIDAIASRRL